jgi:hypothetical protein
MRILAGFGLGVAGCLAAALSALALFAAPPRAGADTIVTVVSGAPNYRRFGNPQFLQTLAGGSFDNPALSDTLTLQVRGQRPITGTLTDAQEFGPPLIFRNLGGGGAIDLQIPNARWLFQAVYAGSDGPGDTLVSDGLVFFNFGRTAHLWLGSNWFDPANFPTPVDSGLFPGLQLPPEQVIPGLFDPNTGNLQLAPGSVPGLAPAPEPATLTLLGFGTAGLLGYSWRRRRRLGQEGTEGPQ